VIDEKLIQQNLNLKSENGNQDTRKKGIEEQAARFGMAVFFDKKN